MQLWFVVLCSLFCGSSSFDLDIVKRKNAIVRVSSRDCALCEHTRSEWIRFKKRYDAEDVVLDEVFCEDDVSVCETLNVHSYPSLVFNFGNGWVHFNHQLNNKNTYDMLAKQVPTLCRFPDDIAGCDHETIEWTHKTAEHAEFDFDKELEKAVHQIKKFTKGIQKFIHRKKIIHEKQMFLKSMQEEL